jgi:hypothetical protein
MPNTKRPHSHSDIFQNQAKRQKSTTRFGDGRQDKRADTTARIPSTQPARSDIPSRAQTKNSKTTRIQNPPGPNRRTVQLTLWISPIEKAEIQRRAEGENLSVSSVGAALLRKALQTDIDMQYGALLEPVIAHTIDRRLKTQENRLALLLVRACLAVEQTRILTTNLLGRHPDITPGVLNEILDFSRTEAKKKLTKRSTELQELITEVKAWLSEKEKKP